MKRLVVASLMAVAASFLASDTASAQVGSAFSYSPCGFGVPFAQFYGAVQTPPYFATHPPVYYGTRYSRPYGISPYAAPPVVNVPTGYEAGPAARFYYPPAEISTATCNPYIIGKRSESPKPSTPKLAVVGEIRYNPFVESSDRLAKN